MARIFLSHSSADNFEAVAVRDYLAAEGWDDIFLDIDTDSGIAAAEKWERSLHEAANRCEAVIFLVSRAWLASQWCVREFNLAMRLNKRLFGVLIEDIPIADLRSEMTAWQVVDLAAGQDGRIFRAVMPSGEKHVTYSRAGLDKLKHGLRRAGLDPRFFEWPPKGDPYRPPYRGMKPLEAEDAGIFFGRESHVIEALDRLRRLVDATPPSFLAILGASGAGKSSFMRAGLLPRLSRDDRNFLALPVIRPERAILSGDNGFVASLEEAFRRAGAPRSRAECRAAIAAGAQATGALLATLVNTVRAPQLGAEGRQSLPAVVIAVDQGEELFLADGRTEAEPFLALLAGLLVADTPRVITLVTIRSDSYESLQTAKQLEGIRQETFSLPPMAKGAFQLVIEGPSMRLRDTNRALRIEPALTSALLADVEADGSKDALPLLAFTLERLYREYGTAGDLKLNDYRAMGGVKGSIDAAVERAMTAAETDPDLRNVIDRPALLRRAIIPGLASIDQETRTPRRRVARLSEIPIEAHPFIRLLVAERLLSTEQIFDNEGRKAGDVTVEPAHESLLRQWFLLQTWLTEEGAAYATIDSVQRAAAEWQAHACDDAWLAHQDGRLEDAEKVAAREDFGRLIQSSEYSYLVAARMKDDELRHQQVEEARKLTHHETIGLAALSRIADADNLPIAAVKLALAAWPRAGDSQRPPLAATISSLRASLPDLREKMKLDNRQGSITCARYSWDGRRILTSSSDRTVRVWDATTGAQLMVVMTGHDGDLMSAAFSFNDQRIVTASYDGTARVWDSATGTQILELKDHPGWVTAASFSLEGDGERILTVCALERSFFVWNAASGEQLLVVDTGDLVFSADFSPDGKRIVTGLSGGKVLVWDALSGAQIVALEGCTQYVASVSFAPDGNRIVAGSADKTARVWDTGSGTQLLQLIGHEGSVRAAFSRDGSRIITASTDKTCRIWNSATGTPILVLRGHRGGLTSAEFSPDGKSALTGSLDKTVRQWNAETATQIRRFDVGRPLQAATLSPTGKRIAVASRTGAAQIIDVTAKAEVLELFDGETGSNAIAFSPDGTRIVTASNDMIARVWDSYTGERDLLLTGHQNQVTSVAFSHDGTRIVTSSLDGTLIVWDAQSGRRLNLISCPDSWMFSGRFSPDDHSLIAGSNKNSAYLWDALSGALIFELKGHEGPVSSTQLSSDGRRIITGADDGSVRIWDAASGAQILQFALDMTDVNTATFSHNGERIVTASGDNFARVWDAATGVQLLLLSGHEKKVTAADFTLDDERVVTASDDGTVRIWDISSLEKGDAFCVACQRLGNNTDLSDVEALYGLSKLPPICGDNPPLPVGQATRQ